MQDLQFDSEFSFLLDFLLELELGLVQVRVGLVDGDLVGGPAGAGCGEGAEVPVLDWSPGPTVLLVRFTNNYLTDLQILHFR